MAQEKKEKERKRKDIIVGAVIVEIMTLVDEVIFKVARIGIDCILLVAKKEIIVGVYSIVEVIIRLVSL